jgi:hypothetical protein
MSKLDLLLTSIPPSYINEPSLAPALLKGAVQSQGFTCQTVDLSLECFHKVFDKNYDDFLKWCNVLPDHCDWQKVSEQQVEFVDKAVDLLISIIGKTNPKYLAISVFSVWQQRFCYFLCQKIKQKKIHVQIIIGGMGCQPCPTGLTSVAKVTSMDLMSSFAKFMQKANLVDHVILNDGETELLNILKHDKSISEVSNEVPFDYSFLPNFDDYKLDDYLFINKEKKLLIQGSKGCVRQCVFCSEHSNYSTFYFKTGGKIAEEMISLSQKYNIFKFQFTDSLVNGSLSQFKEFIKKLATYNQKNPDKKIAWHGNYICRSKNTLTDDDFITLKLSGAHGLTIGAESGSNKVLAEMKKQSTVEDLEYEISKFKQFGINCSLLFLMGFYNEYWKDFMETLELLKRLHKYFYTGTINHIRCGYTLSITNWSHIDKNKFTCKSNNAYDWIYLPNPTLTLKERIRRRIIIQEFCDRLHIPISYAHQDLLVLMNIYNNNLQDLPALDYGHN